MGQREGEFHPFSAYYSRGRTLSWSSLPRAFLLSRARATTHFPTPASYPPLCPPPIPLISCLTHSLPPLVYDVRDHSDGIGLWDTSERGCFTYSFPRRHNSSLRKKGTDRPADDDDVASVSSYLCSLSLSLFPPITRRFLNLPSSHHLKQSFCCGRS